MIAVPRLSPKLVKEVKFRVWLFKDRCGWTKRFFLRRCSAAGCISIGYAARLYRYDNLCCAECDRKAQYEMSCYHAHGDGVGVSYEEWKALGSNYTDAHGRDETT